jgi:DNA-binding NarL/FixJ family response regulator
MILQNELQKHIRKLIGTLHVDEVLAQVLKARLTKREYKLLTGWAEGISAEEISQKLKLDVASYEAFSSKLIKKLNQEKLKQELVE